MWELVFLIIVVLATFGVTVWVLVDCYQKSNNCLESPASGTASGTASTAISAESGLAHRQDGANYQMHQSYAPQPTQQTPRGLSLEPDPQGCVVEGTEAKQFKLAHHETGVIGMHLESDGANFQTSVVVGQTEVFFMPLPSGESSVDCEFDVVEGEVVTVTVRNSTRQRMRLLNCTLTAS